jgi:hypothetical protein
MESKFHFHQNSFNGKTFLILLKLLKQLKCELLISALHIFFLIPYLFAICNDTMSKIGVE